MTPTPNLTADARNRALRTFLQGLAVDLLATVGAYLLPFFTSWNAPEDIQWKVLAFGLAKTVATTVVSYTMRRFLDGSAVPTPLPPSDPGPPAEPAPNVTPDLPLGYDGFGAPIHDPGDYDPRHGQP